MARRVESIDSQTVRIYFETPPQETGRPSVAIDKISVLSNIDNVVKGAAIVKDAVDITQKVGDMGQKAAAARPQAMPDVVKLEVKTTLVVTFEDVGKVQSKSSRIVDDWNPFKQTKVETLTTKTHTVTITTTRTDYPFFEPEETQDVDIAPLPATIVSSPPSQQSPTEPCAPIQTPPESQVRPSQAAPQSNDAAEDPQKLAPEDNSAKPNQELFEPFMRVLQGFATVEFDSSSGAKEYFDFQLKQAGLDVTISSQGMKVTQAGPTDPAGVEGQLRGQGVEDESLIDEARAEANSIIAEFELAIASMQNDLSIRFPIQAEGAASSEDGTGNAAEGEEPTTSSGRFYAAVKAWDEAFHHRFDIEPPGPTGDAGDTLVLVNGALVRTLTSRSSGEPNSPLAPATQPKARMSRSGLRVRAGVGVQVADPTWIGGTAGFHASPITSVFAAEAWKRRA